MSRPLDRQTPKTYLCGWCANAARATEPVAHHRHCASARCACGAAGHRFDRTIAETMARTTRLELDDIYAAHGRKRRVLTDEQRARAIANLRRTA